MVVATTGSTLRHSGFNAKTDSVNDEVRSHVVCLLLATSGEVDPAIPQQQGFGYSVIPQQVKGLGIMSSAQEQTINQLRSDILKLKNAIELVNDRLNATQNDLFAHILVLSSGLAAMDEPTKERARIGLASVIKNFPDDDKGKPEFLEQASEIAATVFAKRT